MSTGGVLTSTLHLSMASTDESIPSYYDYNRDNSISSSKDWSQSTYSAVGDESISSTKDWSKFSPMSYTQEQSDASSSPQVWTNLSQSNNLQFTEVPLESVLSPSISQGMKLELLSSPDEELDRFADSGVSTSSSQEVKEERSTALKYPPCAVCTGKSSGLHYGCYTCEACKNFFRRYLLRNDGFNCKKRGNCAITNRSRGNCSGCRLKKCLAVGMSKEKSKIGRYTHAQRTETIREVNKLEGKAMDDDSQILFNLKSGNSPDSQNSIKLQSEIKVEVEEDEEFNFEMLSKLIVEMEKIQPFGERGSTAEGRLDIITEHYEKYLAKVKLFGPLGAIPKEEFFTLLKLYNIDLDERWNIFKREANNCEHIVRKYVDFAYHIPGFKDQLSKKDQEMLLKLGHSDFFVILMHEGYIEEYNIFLEMNGVPSHVEEAADKIFSRTLIELQCTIFKKWQKLNLTKEEITLLISMAVVSSDRCELENQELVESMHTRLTNLLMKFLEANYGSEAHKRFSKFIDVLLICRYGSELYYKEYQEMSENQMVTEAAPAFPTLCPDKS